MSRRVCETCAWWVAGEYEHGICAYHDERGYMPGRVTCRMHSGIWDEDDFCSKAKKMED